MMNIDHEISSFIDTIGLLNDILKTIWQECVENDDLSQNIDVGDPIKG